MMLPAQNSSFLLSSNCSTFIERLTQIIHWRRAVINGISAFKI
jgi:hypothetical protein